MQTTTRTQFVPLTYQHADLTIAANVRLTSNDLIVFMHGFGCAKESFDGAFDADGLRDFSLCAFDFPGHGASSRSDASTYSPRSYADVARLVIDNLAPARVFVACHSMGSAAGLIAAPAIPNLGCFVNIEGNLVAEDCSLVSRTTADQSTDAFIHDGYGQLARTLAGSSRRDYKAWSQWYGQADPLALHESARSLVEWSDSGALLEQFRSLKHRVYIYGDEDNKDYLLPQLHQVPTCCIRDAGHFPMLDNPQEFYAVLAELLNGARTSSDTPQEGDWSWPFIGASPLRSGSSGHGLSSRR